MKRFALLPLLFVLLLSVHSDLYSQDEAGNQIAGLIRKADARELARHFNVMVQLTLPDNDGRFSRAQAELIVRDFFVKHPPKSFSISHQGSSSDGSRYYIGVYKSVKKDFRSYYLIKQVDDKPLIHQLRFEDDD